MSDISDGDYVAGSGSEYEYEYGSDYEAMDEQGGEEEHEAVIEVENAFYEGDDIRGEDPGRALELFRKVVRLEREAREADPEKELKWSFKALEKTAVLLFGMGHYEEGIEVFRELLKHMDTVTRNECAESLNNVLDAAAAMGSEHSSVMTSVFRTTLEVLKAQHHDRLWFNTSVKLARMYLDLQDTAELRRVIDELYHVCEPVSAHEDASKSTMLMEVYALDIQWCAMTGDSQRMKEVYPKVLQVQAAIPDPRVMGVIRENGGKMYMREGAWTSAYNELYQAFRHYQEAGNARAKLCLKYLVLANMMSLSDIDPFASREVRALQDDPEVKAMIDLRRAYSASDVHQFLRVLRDRRNHISEDEFMRAYVEQLLQTVRGQAVSRIVKPYERMKLETLAQEVKMDASDLELLLVGLIVDGKLDARVDQVNRVVYIGGRAGSSRRYAALVRWEAALDGARKQLSL